MEKQYPIYCGSEKAGTAQVTKDGLYMRFCCRCDLMGAKFSRIQVTAGNKTTDLGICVPIDGSFGIDTSVPCRKIGAGELRFTLESESLFYPIQDGEPFPYLELVTEGRLEVRNGQPGLAVKSPQASVRRGSDQSL